jgi:hypothetical protein
MLNRGTIMKDFLQRHPLLRRALLLLIVFYCLHGAVLELRAHRQYQQVAKWPEAQAGLTSSGVYSTNYSWNATGGRSCPRLEYTYTVGVAHMRDTTRFSISCAGRVLTTLLPNIGPVLPSQLRTIPRTQRRA